MEKSIWRNWASWRMVATYKDSDGSLVHDTDWVPLPGHASWWVGVNVADVGFQPVTDAVLARDTWSAITRPISSETLKGVPKHLFAYATEGRLASDLLLDGINEKQPSLMGLVRPHLPRFIERHSNLVWAAREDDSLPTYPSVRPRRLGARFRHGKWMRGRRRSALRYA